MIIDLIKQNLKQAMLDRNELSKTTLGGLVSAIRYVEIEKKQALSDDDVIAILKKQLKQRNESIELYNRAGNQEAVNKESSEAELIKKYLPEELSEAEIETVVAKIALENSFGEMKDMGRLISLSKESLGAGADGALVAQVAKRVLGA